MDLNLEDNSECQHSADLGSTVLSKSTFQESLTKNLALSFPVPVWAQKLLDGSSNLVHLEVYNERFAPLALQLRKVWSFVEGWETKLKVLGSNSSTEAVKQTISTKVDHLS